jgi:hypothetical protein
MNVPGLIARCLFTTTTCLAASAAVAQHATGHAAGDGEMQFHSPQDIQWKPGPGSLPPGAKFAVLEGDPAKEGPFVMRLMLPDGFRIQPHWHPKVERITIISGTFNIGMGDKFDATATRAMPAGAYGYWGANMRHFVWTKGETVLQLHGVGPWSITYVDPADDPRKKP